MDIMFDFDALEEGLSLAAPHQAEPTILPNPPRPEVTKPVEETQLHFRDDKYEGDQCQLEDHPHCDVAYKSMQEVLRQLRNQGQLDNRYPHITPQPLRVWKKTSSGGNPALGEAASSSSGGNPVTLEPAAVESTKEKIAAGNAAAKKAAADKAAASETAADKTIADEATADKTAAVRAAAERAAADKAAAEKAAAEKAADEKGAAEKAAAEMAAAENAAAEKAAAE